MLSTQSWPPRNHDMSWGGGAQVNGSRPAHEDNVLATFGEPGGVSKRWKMSHTVGHVPKGLLDSRHGPSPKPSPRHEGHGFISNPPDYRQCRHCARKVEFVKVIAIGSLVCQPFGGVSTTAKTAIATISISCSRRWPADALEARTAELHPPERVHSGRIRVAGRWCQ